MNDKPKELEEHSAQIFELGCMERHVYLKEDVDAAIAGLKQKLQDQCISCPVKMQEDDVVAELKEQYKDIDVTHTVHIAKMNARIEELEESLESEKASRYADSVDAGMRERKLKRALWLAMAELCHRLDVDGYLRKHRNSWYNENCLTWAEACAAMEVKMCKAESKCRSKAEEY